MLAGEKELARRFADYADEELRRILTAERARYRREALAAAEKVLTQRGLTPPPAPAAASRPPARPGWPEEQAGGRERPKSPYQFIDLLVDALLFGSLYWVTGELEGVPLLPGAGLLDGAVRLLLSASVTVVVIYLRHSWRTKEWRD